MPKDDDEGGSGRGGSGGGGGGDGGTPGLPPRKTVQEEMDEIVKRLDYLRANTPDVFLDTTPLQNSRVIARKNNEKLVNQQLKGCVHYLNRYATIPMYILYQLNEKK